MIIRKKGANKTDKGVTLLEIPLLTLSSPQTILCKIGEINEDNEVYRTFINTCNKYRGMPGQQFYAMNAVINYIDANEQNLGNGYKKLRALCNMWLFTNNGVKFIGDPSFNLAKSAKNLGVKFIGSREADGSLVNDTTLAKLNFRGMWKSLRSEADSRPEVIYSSVMISTNEYYDGTPIIPAGHPFVLRLDAPPALLGWQNVTDEMLMSYYIK